MFASGQISATPPAVIRSVGEDETAGIEWVLLSVEGRRTAAGDAAAPLLTAQCYRGGHGALKFELLATDPVGVRSEPVFQAPWRPTPGVLFAPTLLKKTVTMEFLGYTHVKPVKRQWEYPDGATGVLRYSTPGARSSNMEPVMFYLRYLSVLPTLRLTLPDGQGEEFETTAFRQAVHAEPLCAASGW